MADDASAAASAAADHVIAMEEGLERSSSSSSAPSQPQPQSGPGRAHRLHQRLSSLASSLRSPAVALHVGSIDEEMDDYIRHEEAIEAEGQDVEAPLDGLPPSSSSYRERAVPFEEGGRLGRFLVTKRVGLPLGEGAGHGAAGGSIVDVPVVVFLFGWLTCQDRHLQKYAELYHKLGFPLVCRHTGQ